MIQTLKVSLAVLCLASTSLAAMAAPKVTASIVPVHALVSSVMDGIGEPALLLSGQNSEHQASYSPSQIRTLAESDLVFIIGEGLELKLDELSGSEAVKGKTFIELADLKGLTKHAIREGGAWEAHDHEHEHEHPEGEAKTGQDHDHGKKTEEAGHDHGEEGHSHGTAEFDPHIWLDPENAKVMLTAIAAELSKADPDNAARYSSNATAAIAGIDAMTKELAATLEPVKAQPFVVFHDAYQYFEARFGLSAAGSISDISATAPSAKRLEEVRNKLKKVKAVCAFREPQFSDKAVKVVIEDTAAREGVLDPIGATLEPGKQAYRQLLTNLAANLKSCLAGS